MIRINGAGCALIDNLYNDVQFDSPAFQEFLSQAPGDGGLVPGQLVFAEDFARFASRNYERLLREVTGRGQPDRFNVGGPGVIPLVHLGQTLERPDFAVAFSGLRGEDQSGERIQSALSVVPGDFSLRRVAGGSTPTTDVLSDPNYDGGRGERTFINRLGVASTAAAAAFPDDYLSADIVYLGGTALVPPLHDSLTRIAREAKESGAFVAVGTVYDFRNEKKTPEQSWPLVDDYSVVDLLIMDREEARRISGESEEREALNWFVRRGCGAVVITRGPDDVLFKSSSVKFANSGFGSLPVVADIRTHIERFGRDHDTTGCGDNFAGGTLGSIARQLFREEKTLDLVDAVAEGVIAGGHAATYLGGLYQEEEAGQKRLEIASLREHYRAQIGKGAS